MIFSIFFIMRRIKKKLRLLKTTIANFIIFKFRTGRGKKKQENVEKKKKLNLFVLKKYHLQTHQNDDHCPHNIALK